jgi:hypothetical protein
MDESPVTETVTLQHATPLSDATGLALVVERLAANPDVDVLKLEKIIELQERLLASQAKAAFDAAFALMQPEIPEIDEKGRLINHKTDTLQSMYAKNEDIQKVLRPILARHGFSLSFRTEWLDERTVVVFGILSHRDGHSRESTFRSKADDSGNKNAIQALGSTISYGHRYTTTDLLNITSREPGRGADDDGASSEKYKQPAAPEGYDAWWAVLEGLAKDGFAPLSSAWNKSKQEFCTYNAKYEKHKWDALKNAALTVDKAAKK